MFKNQTKEYMLYENRLLYNKLDKAKNLMNQTIFKFKSYSVY
jgi:hypothetical protein